MSEFPLHSVQDNDFAVPPLPAPQMIYTEATAPVLQGSEKTGLLQNEACRFCEEAVNSHDFIRPCLCERRCHRQCLDRARALDAAYLNQCPVCNFQYDTELIPDPDKCTPMCKFKCLVFRDLFLLMALVQGIICLLGFAILPAIDGGGWRLQWFPRGYPIASINYVSGLVIFFAILGVVGLLTLLVRACSAACSCCCQCCYDEDDGAYYRDHSHTYYSGPQFFFCFYPIPSPYYGGHHHHHHVHQHHGGGCTSCACLGCGSCNNCHGGGGGNNNDAGAALLIVILVLAVIGVIFALIISVLLLTRLYHRHAKIAQRYHQARKNRVRDLSNGRPGGMAAKAFQAGVPLME